MSKNSLTIIKGSKVHGKGLFAKRKILNGTRIGQYIGKILSSAQVKNSKRDCAYLFLRNDGSYLDGSDLRTNRMGYVNHANPPNENVESRELKDGTIWLYAIKDIPRDKELLFDYGYDAGALSCSLKDKDH